MDEEAVRTPAPTRYSLGDDLSRLSVRDLEALKAALEAELARVEREIAAKGSSRDAADAFFRR